MKTMHRRLALLLVAVVATVATANAEEPLRFVRVHVPPGRLGEIELGTERYVPMSLREFEAAVSRLDDGAGADGPLDGATPLLDIVRYDTEVVAEGGGLVMLGTATWTTRGTFAAVPFRPLGRLPVVRARMNTSAGTGDVPVFGRADGSLAIAAAQPGTYTCSWRSGQDPGGDGQVVFTMPLVPALASTIRLQLPAGMRPEVGGAVVTPAAMEEGSPGRPRPWLIETGPRSQLAIRLVSTTADEAVAPRLTSWTAIGIVGRQARLRTLLVPDVPWRAAVEAGNATVPPTFSLRKDPRTVVTAVRLHGTSPLAPDPRWVESADGRELTVWVPAACLGRIQAFEVAGVTPFDAAGLVAVPLLRVADELWGGGGIVVEADATQVFSDLQLDQAAVVTAEEAADWPLPGLDADSGGGVEPARLCIEEQGPQARIRLSMAGRVAEVDVQRVTVVDVSPDVVLARATCAVRVRQGETFELVGRLGGGWFIDTVETVAAAVRPPLATASVAPIGDAPEWRIVRAGDESELRVAFANAVTPAKPVMLQITGHRGGVTPGTAFMASEIDMIRFDGSERDPVLAVKTGAEMTIDTATEPEPVAVEDPRLAMLLDEGGVRMRIPAGRRAVEQGLRLARRRPPLDVSTQVRLTSRDGRLVESFTFECSPDRTEIDSIVVHFSTVMDDRLEWSLLPPASGTLVARRIETTERGEDGPGESIADSWVVELSPPARHPVTIRAACTVPFSGALPVPMAWVDGATRQTGTIEIREAGQYRPQVVNRRLTELPPRDGVAENAFAVVAEFSFDAGRGSAADSAPAAELLPGGGPDQSRAWAVSEATTVWCHASGVAEYQTRFAIENQGRAAVAVALPAGLRMQGAFVDGRRVPVAARGTGGGDVAIQLPSGRRSIDLMVRAVSEAALSRHPWWTVEIHGGTIDVPVLHREVRVVLAPGIEIARGSPTHRMVAATPRSDDWPERLFAARLRSFDSSSTDRAAASEADSVGAGPVADALRGSREFRLVPVVSRRDGGGLLLVRSDLVWSAAIVVAAASLAVVAAAPAGIGWVPSLIAMLAAIGALWAAPPFDGACRAAWWGAVAGGVLRTRPVWLGRAALVGFVVVNFATVTAADELADGVSKVFITPVDGAGTADPMALVPEPLFRRLARSESRPAEPRVTSCAVTVGEATGPAQAPIWRLVIDVDADAGAVLPLDHRGSGVRVIDVSIDGRPAVLRDVGGSPGVPLADGGRHRVECRLEPAVVRRGEIETMTAPIPVAPRSTLTLADDATAAACDRALVGGPFLPALPAESGVAGRFDIARAAAVRIVRSLDPRLRLTASVPRAESRNDLFWDLDGCRVNAAFAIDVPNEIVRSFVIRVAPGAGSADAGSSWRLEAGDGDACDVVPLGGDRYLIERRDPQPGAFTTRIALRKPLADPVGVFRLPEAWIEGAAADTRLTQFVPAGDLVADVRLPENAVAAPRGVDSPLQSLAWRSDIAKGAERTANEGLAPRPRRLSGGTLTVRRRRPEPRAAQRLAIDFFADQIAMELSARIDAGDAPLVKTAIDLPAAAVIDRIGLWEERGLETEAASRKPVDVNWERTASGRVLLVVQRPRAGRFRLEVAARVVGRVANRGSFAVLRADAAGLVPLVVTWTSRDGRGMALTGSFDEAVGAAEAIGEVEAIGEEPAGLVASPQRMRGSIELLGGEVALHYERGEDGPLVDPAATAEVARVAAEEETPDQRVRRVELADISIALDPRGRCWGTVRFDVVAVDSKLRLAVPAGLRLFETLVDGRPAPVTPRDDGTWELPLLETAWPRSLLVVFAGETGAPPGSGRPFEIAVPSPVGYPCARMLWTVRSPGDEMLRIAAPARLVDGQTLVAERRAAFGRLVGDYRRAVETADGIDRARREAFMAGRGAAPLATETARMPASMAEGDVVLHAVIDDPMVDGRVVGLAVRMGRRPDPTAWSRALATLLLVGLVGLAWIAARMRSDRWRQALSRWLPPAAAAVGVFWLLFLEPAWPGGVILVAAVAGMVPRMAPRRVRAAVGDESTVTQFAPPADVLLAPAPVGRQTVVKPQ